MHERNTPSLKRTLAFIAIFVMAVAILALIVILLPLNAEVQRVRSLTPTPLPPYGNVMQVTVDPSAPTPEPVLRNGSTGERVSQLQSRLKELGYYTGSVDGQYGPGTQSAVLLFQQVNGLLADGLAGSETTALLYSGNALPAPTPEPTTVASYAQIASVADIQQRLKELGYYTGSVDGISGSGTRRAIMLFQEQHGLTADGVYGPNTGAVLFSDDARPVTTTPTPDPNQIPGMTADGYPLLVNRDNYIPDGYQTTQLVNLRDYCDASIVTIKGSDIQGEKMAVDALMAMIRAARADGHKGWQVNAGYRSVQYQQELFDSRVYALRQEGYSGSQARAKVRETVADPGASEHHTGLAFDVAITGESAFGATKQSVWLAQHCWEYGFILRYPADKVDITGFSHEPWHIRYVGTTHSLIMRDENLCLEEYLAKYAR